MSDVFSTASYGRAIARACKHAGVERWSPNMLRKRAATDANAALGRDAARTLLGHRDERAILHYITESPDLAVRVPRQLANAVNGTNETDSAGAATPTEPYATPDNSRSSDDQHATRRGA